VPLATRTALALCIAVAGVSAAAEPTPRATRLFSLVCAQCHARPGIGVPQIGDREAWREPLARGREALLASTVEGRGGMPPLGGCSFCSEAELRDLIALLTGGASAP
jgi:cytochrome c5